MNGIVSEQLRRSIDGRQSAADHERGKPDLQIRQSRSLVCAGELQCHQEVGCLADAACQIVFDIDNRRATRARGDGNMIESPVPGIVDGKGAAEANTAINAEQIAP